MIATARARSRRPHQRAPQNHQHVIANHRPRIARRQHARPRIHPPRSPPRSAVGIAVVAIASFYERQTGFHTFDPAPTTHYTHKGGDELYLVAPRTLPVLPPRSMVGPTTLNRSIGVRIPGGQPSPLLPCNLQNLKLNGNRHPYRHRLSLILPRLKPVLAHRLPRLFIQAESNVPQLRRHRIRD